MEAWAVVENDIVVERSHGEVIVPWWSFTKTVIAAAALVLVREGALQLDEPQAGRPYTLRHLLQHRSGVADYGGLQAYHEAVARGDEPWSIAALLDSVDVDRLRYEPGHGWAYSNIGYLHVRRLVEQATGTGLDGALRRLVLEPLGIGTARVALEPDDLAGIVMGKAEGYHPGWVYHGLLTGSAEDAALLLHRLMEGSLLPPELLRAMFSPFMLPGPVEGRPWTKPGYGLGTMCGETTKGMPVMGHTGRGPGSTIAVYGVASGRPLRTAAFYATDQEEAVQEEKAFSRLAARETP